MLPEQAFLKLGKKLQTLEGKGSAPPPPDYSGAARETATGNLDAARAAAAANRVNQITPYGQLTYTRDPTAVSPDEGHIATTTLSPVEQQKLNQTNNLELGLLGTAQRGIGSVDQLLSTGGRLDESRLAQNSISGQTVQDAIFSRLSPQLDRDRESLRTRLANQGLFNGSEGYNNSVTDEGKRENDLYIQAALQGIGTGQTSRQQGIQEQYAAQDRPLNIVNALRTGNQVNLPQFTNVPQQATTNGADLLGAAQLQGQYTSGAAASKNAAGAQLAGAGLTAAGAVAAAAVF